MGFGVVDICKVAESDSHVTYAFEHEGKSGRFSIDRVTGEFTEVVPDVIDRKRSALWAAQQKVRQHWRAGEFPDKTIWAG